MVLLTLGFVVFCIGGTLFKKGETDRSPGEVVAISRSAHAFSIAGITLMAAGGLVTLAAGL